MRQFDIIKIKKCVVKKVGKNADNQQSVIVFTEPIKIVYKNLSAKIGHPKESRSFGADSAPLRSNYLIPTAEVMKNLPVEEHEVIFAQGGSIPLSKLSPMLKGRWRIKVRVTKRGEIRTWNNAKGEGKLMNIEFMDKDGA